MWLDGQNGSWNWGHNLRVVEQKKRWRKTLAIYRYPTRILYLGTIYSWSTPTPQPESRKKIGCLLFYTKEIIFCAWCTVICTCIDISQTKPCHYFILPFAETHCNSCALQHTPARKTIAKSFRRSNLRQTFPSTIFQITFFERVPMLSSKSCMQESFAESTFFLKVRLCKFLSSTV